MRYIYIYMIKLNGLRHDLKILFCKKRELRKLEEL